MMILLSVTVYCLNTMPDLNKHKAWRSTRYVIDMFCMCWFTIEFMIRILVCPDRKGFIQSVMNWIDFLSIIPSYLILFFEYDKLLINLVIIRLLRLFRFFKLSYGLQVLLHTLKASSYELVLLLLILLIPVVIFSSLVHTAETNLTNGGLTKFISIPHTFWWCLITMTSVGYGDMVPETWAGKVVGGFCAICGVLIVALPISVIGSNFSLYYAHVRARLKLPSKDRKILAGNLRGLLKQPLSLSSRERDRRSLKRNNMVAIRRKDPPKRGSDRMARFALNTQPSSSDEGTNKPYAKELDSSEICLDWDSTMDSEIQLKSDKIDLKRLTEAIPSRSRNEKGRRQAVVSLFEGSESEAESQSSHSEVKVPVTRGRRGGQISLDATDNQLNSGGSAIIEVENDEFGDQEEEAENEADVSMLKEVESRKSSFLDQPISACSSKRGSLKQESSSQNTPSSRRSSMKLMELNMIPERKSPIPTPSSNIPSEKGSSNDEPGAKSNHLKQKKTKKKKRDKSSPVKNAQHYRSVRRGGILPVADYDGDMVNGYSTDSSAGDSYIPALSSHESPRSPMLDREFSGDDDADRNSIGAGQISDISVELIPRLQRLKRETQWREPDVTAKPMLNSRGLGHKSLYHCNSLDYNNPKIMLQQKLLRKSSRSEFDIRTKCGGLFIERNFWHDKDPIIREVSSDIDLGYIESGV